MINGIVVKKISNTFSVKCGEKLFSCSAKGTLKKDGIFVGDSVVVNEKDEQIILINKRQNLLIRPPVANLEQLVVVIAPIPQPDFTIVDKLILFAFANGISPILCVNKTDLADEKFLENIKKQYQNVLEIVFISAKENKNIENLKELLKGKLSAFAGQSAVGKSKITKVLFPEREVEIGELSEKIARGKNTTRVCEIFEKDGIRIIDTPGFSSLDECLLQIPYFELTYFYPDFLKFMDKCKFKPCSHISEKECAVKDAIKNGLVDKARYERYKTIYENLKEKWRKTHG